MLTSSGANPRGGAQEGERWKVSICPKASPPFGVGSRGATEAGLRVASARGLQGRGGSLSRGCLANRRGLGHVTARRRSSIVARAQPPRTRSSADGGTTANAPEDPPLGARTHGYEADHWTLKRMTEIIRDEFGMEYTESGAWRLLRAMGFAAQVPPAGHGAGRGVHPGVDEGGGAEDPGSGASFGRHDPVHGEELSAVVPERTADLGFPRQSPGDPVSAGESPEAQPDPGSESRWGARL